MPRLDKDLWQALSPLLDSALELNPAERDALLARIERERPTLAAVLGRLLAAHDGLVASEFLESSPLIDGEPPRSLAGQTIGAYTLEVPLGMGGMGTVWRARRSDGRYEGFVAVKLLNLALVGQVGEERFRREGTLLARLAHPHIARLLDAGVTATGQPFLVLEYVEGTRIDREADEKQLAPAARLELFLQVADAVIHAHANLIAHRDLKPSNILVARDGAVKLLDFGIGKLIEQAAPDRHEDTLGAAPAFTPDYASPEQVRGEAVTTTADVYALGVLLHTLLTGRHPTGADCRSAAAHLRALAEREPERASDAVTASDPDDPPGARATRRGSTPDRLRRLYRGDLDHIVGAALRKVPAERYASVAAFADDVRRYLRHEPVSVRAEQWRYRTWKFVRRHRAGVATAATIAALLVIATVVTTTQMLEARRQRDAAEFQARRAQASSEFMRNLVTQIGDKPMTMKDVLDRGREALEQQYGDDPAFVARMLMHLSGPYLEMGDYATVDRLMARALEIAATLDDPDLLVAANCAAGSDAVDRRDLAAAQRHLDEARRQLPRIAAPSPGVEVECAIGETSLARAEGRTDDAIRHAEDAVRLLERVGNTRTSRYTSALSNLAGAYYGTGRYRDAVVMYRKLIDVSRSIGRGRTTAILVVLNNRSGAERALGWWLAAERTTLEALELARGLDSSGRPSFWLALSHGRTLGLLGRYPEASQWLGITLGDRDSAPVFRVGARLALAAAALDQGDPTEARRLVEAVVPDLDPVPPTPTRIAVLIARARIEIAERRIEEARTLLRDELPRHGYPERLSPEVHQLLDWSGRLALQIGDVDQAVQLARDAVRACDLHFGTDVPSALTGRARLTLGLALAAGGRAREASSELTRAAALIQAAAGESHPWAREAREALTRTGG